MPEAERSGWQHLLPTLVLASTGLLVLGVQPLLYVAYIHAGAITEARLGLLAAVEISAIAVGSMTGIHLLRHISARIVGMIGLMVLLLGNLLPEVWPLFATRAVAGFGGGIVVALAAAQIALRANVNAASGLFLFLQAASQYASLQAVSLLAPDLDARGLQILLAALAAAAAPLLLAVPRRLALHDEAAGPSRPPLAGVIGLAVSALFVGSAIAVWAYLGLWLQSAGIAERATASMLTVALAGQIVGALIAVALGMRWRSDVQVAVSGGAMIMIVMVLLASDPASASGWALLFGFGLVWMLGTPALSGLLLALDPSRKALPFAASAQLLGAALIPTLTGELLAAEGMDRVLQGGTAITAVALILLGLGIVLVRKQGEAGRFPCRVPRSSA